MLERRSGALAVAGLAQRPGAQPPGVGGVWRQPHRLGEGARRGRRLAARLQRAAPHHLRRRQSGRQLASPLGGSDGVVDPTQRESRKRYVQGGRRVVRL